MTALCLCYFKVLCIKIFVLFCTETVSPVVMEEIAKLATDSCEVNSHVTVGDAKNGGNSDSPSELISASAALQPCAEAVAEKARRMTIERRSATCDLMCPVIVGACQFVISTPLIQLPI